MPLQSMAAGGLPTHRTWTGQNGLNVRSGATLANHHVQYGCQVLSQDTGKTHGELFDL